MDQDLKKALDSPIERLIKDDLKNQRELHKAWGASSAAMNKAFESAIGQTWKALDEQNKMLRNLLPMDPLKLTMDDSYFRKIMQASTATEPFLVGEMISIWQQPAFSKELLGIGSVANALEIFAKSLSPITASMETAGMEQVFAPLALQMESIFKIYPRFEREQRDVLDFFEKNPIQKPKEIPTNLLFDTKFFLEKSFDLSIPHLVDLSEVSVEETNTNEGSLLIPGTDGTWTPVEEIISGSIALTPTNSLGAIRLWHYASGYLYNIALKGNDPAVEGINNWAELFRNLILITTAAGAFMKYVL